MKSLLLFFFLLIGSSVLYAQSNQFIIHTENLNHDPIHLELLPWDNTRLIQINRMFTSNIEPYLYIYGMEDVTMGVPIGSYIPQCMVMKTRPMFLENGILVGGQSWEKGIELFYYDGIDYTMYDINVGFDDSNPQIYEVQGEVFVIASSGGFRQLYRFDEVTKDLVQITDEDRDVAHVVDVWDNSTYYSVYDVLGSDADVKLKKALFDGTNYSYSIVRTVTVPALFGADYEWDEPIIKWNKLFLKEEFYSTLSGEIMDKRIVSVDQNDQDIVMHEYLQAPSYFKEQLFEWNDKVCFFLQGDTTAYSSTDGSIFNIEFAISNEYFREYSVTENNDLFFTTWNGMSYAINSYDGSFQQLYLGEHLHLMLETNEILYFSNHVGSPGSSSIVLVDAMNNTVAEVQIHEFQYHVGPDESALIFDDKFTFLFATPTNLSTDVLQLTGDPFVELKELEADVQIYPNPIFIGELFNVQSNQSGEYAIYSADGKRIQFGELYQGTNTIQLNDVESGVYLLKLNESSQRLVIH